MNFQKFYRLAIFILILLQFVSTTSATDSASYLTGMVFYLAKSVMDGGLPEIVRTMRAGKSVPFVDNEVTRQTRRNDIRAFAREAIKTMDNESRVKRLIRQLWPGIECDDDACKAHDPKRWGSHENHNNNNNNNNEDGGKSTSSSEEHHEENGRGGGEGPASAEEEVEKRARGLPETNVEEMAEEDEEEDDPNDPNTYYNNNNNRDRMRKELSFEQKEREREARQRYRRMQRDWQQEFGGGGGPPPPPPPRYSTMDFSRPPAPYSSFGPPPPHHHHPSEGPPPPPHRWRNEDYDDSPHYHGGNGRRRPFLRRMKPKPTPIPVSPGRATLAQDFVRFSKVFRVPHPIASTTMKPTPPPTEPTTRKPSTAPTTYFLSSASSLTVPPGISKRILKLLSQHPGLQSLGKYNYLANEKNRTTAILQGHKYIL